MQQVRVFWKSRLFLIIEQLRVILRFYGRSYRFCLADLSMGFLYIFANPYRICRRFFQKKRENDIHVYGETPLTLWAEIAKNAEISSADQFVDLGCGRGRICFWTSLWTGCKTRGVDWVPSFVDRGRFLARLFGISHLRFDCAGISQISLKEATVVYLYTYHSDEEKIDFHEMPLGGRIITVSEPLIKSGFFIHKSMKALFPWGETDIFINKKI